MQVPDLETNGTVLFYQDNLQPEKQEIPGPRWSMHYGLYFHQARGVWHITQLATAIQSGATGKEVTPP